jgi:hypothetical protein
MKDVIEMASEAGFTEGELAFMGDNFRRFAELVRADEREQGQKWFDAVTAQYKQLILAEREACAKIADEWAVGWPHPSKVIALDIRARGQA